MKDIATEQLEKVQTSFSPKVPVNLQDLDIPASLIEDLMLRRGRKA